MSSNNDRKIYMFIETNKGRIVIPFISLKAVDLFTVEYKNREEFLESFIKNMKLPITTRNIDSMYLGYSDLGYYYESLYQYMPIKYGKDNYNVESVVNCFTSYIEKNPKIFNKLDISKVAKNVLGNFDLSNISRYQIDRIARAYLSTGYKRVRDTYFMICDYEKVIIDKVPTKKNDVEREDLSKLESRVDDYLQYLIELSSRSEEAAERARDELSKIDNDEIKVSLNKMYYGVTDGISDANMADPAFVSSIENSTYIKYDDLRNDMIKRLNNGRKR